MDDAKLTLGELVRILESGAAKRKEVGPFCPSDKESIDISNGTTTSSHVLGTCPSLNLKSVDIQVGPSLKLNKGIVICGLLSDPDWVRSILKEGFGPNVVWPALGLDSSLKSRITVILPFL